MMYKVLSEEEIEQSKEDVNEWWDTLDDEWKLKLYNIFREITR